MDNIKNKTNSLSEKEENILLIILLVVLFVIIYIVTFGNVNIEKSIQFPEEFKDTKEEAERKHKRLKLLINKQETLKKKLSKRFRIAYLAIRLLLVSIWGITLFLLYQFNVINGLSDVLDWSEALLLVIITLNFLTFGNLTNLESFVHTIKTKVENWIFGKYICIDDKIENNKNELINHSLLTIDN